MFKKLLPISVLALAALFSNAFAQVQLDIIYRDFPVTADGFEEFMGCDDEGNNISTKTYFEGNVYNWESRGTELRYGECNDDRGGGKKYRGYKNGPDALQCRDGFSWDNSIKVTRGMVGNRLNYDVPCPAEDIMEDPEGNRKEITHRYCARPTPGPGGGNCSSNHNPGNKVEEWFSSGGNAIEIRDVIELQPEGNFFVINYDYNTTNAWNDDGSDGGFFPLDRHSNSHGRQSLNFWCPSGGTGNTTGFPSICQHWYEAGGPKNPNAGRTAAERTYTEGNQSQNALRKLHNYGFSAAGSGTFKYDETKNDVFEFIGDDDMWIFIDGVLAADLGGVHLAAPAKINIKEYALKQGPWSGREGDVWQNGSTHALNFFYMDRNTDGSNFRLYVSLTGLSQSRFGSPVIKKSVTTVDDNGNYTTQLYVNSKLDLGDVVNRFKNNTNQYGIVVQDRDNNICGYRIDEISYAADAKAEGQVYNLIGKVICGGTERDLSGSDSLSFNVDWDKSTSSGYNNGVALTSEGPIKNESGRAADKLSWAPNTNKLKVPEFNPKVPDDSPIKPDFPEPDQIFGDGAKGGGIVAQIPNGNFPQINSPFYVDPTNSGDKKGNVNSFGTVGQVIPANKTGELVLTAYPSFSKENWKDIVDGPFFGVPPSLSADCDNLCGIANPSQEAKSGEVVSGGYAYVKNGFPDEHNADGSMVLAPTRCISVINGEEVKINCLSFNIPAQQPFQIAVTVYDQLGNFVTQYRETVSDREFRYVTQGPNFVVPSNELPSPNVRKDSNAELSPNDCREPSDPKVKYGEKNVLTTSGRINVGVNIYPFSQTGRKFGNGVYIVKVDRVDLPFEGCFSDGANSDMGKYSFTRYHTDLKFGWVRAGKK